MLGNPQLLKWELSNLKNYKETPPDSSFMAHIHRFSWEWTKGNGLLWCKTLWPLNFQSHFSHIQKLYIYIFCGFSTKWCIKMHTCNITKHQELSMYKQTCVQPSICANLSSIWQNNPCHLPPNWRYCPDARIHYPLSNDLCEYWHILLWGVMLHERKVKPHLLYRPSWCFT
jgi:hypothetical protein